MKWIIFAFGLSLSFSSKADHDVFWCFYTAKALEVTPTLQHQKRQGKGIKIEGADVKITDIKLIKDVSQNDNCALPKFFSDKTIHLNSSDKETYSNPRFKDAYHVFRYHYFEDYGYTEGITLDEGYTVFSP